MNADAVIVAPYEKFENLRILKTKANPIAIRAYTVPVEIPFMRIWNDICAILSECGLHNEAHMSG